MSNPSQMNQETQRHSVGSRERPKTPPATRAGRAGRRRCRPPRGDEAGLSRWAGGCPEGRGGHGSRGRRAAGAGSGDPSLCPPALQASGPWFRCRGRVSLDRRAGGGARRRGASWGRTSTYGREATRPAAQAHPVSAGVIRSRSRGEIIPGPPAGPQRRSQSRVGGADGTQGGGSRGPRAGDGRRSSRVRHGVRFDRDQTSGGAAGAGGQVLAGVGWVGAGRGWGAREELPSRARTSGRTQPPTLPGRGLRLRPGPGRTLRRSRGGRGAASAQSPFIRADPPPTAAVLQGGCVLFPPLLVSEAGLHCHKSRVTGTRRRRRGGGCEDGAEPSSPGGVRAAPGASLGLTPPLLPELRLRERAAVEAGHVCPHPARPSSASVEPQHGPRRPPLAQGPSAPWGGGACSRCRGHPRGLSRHVAWLGAVSGQGERLQESPSTTGRRGRGTLPS